MSSFNLVLLGECVAGLATLSRVFIIFHTVEYKEEDCEALCESMALCGKNLLNLSTDGCNSAAVTMGPATLLL